MGPPLGSRHRHRDPEGPDAPAVRVVQPGRCLDDPPLRRHRARPRDLAASRRADGRNDRCGERARRRLDVPRDDPRRSGRVGPAAHLRAARPAGARRQARADRRRQRDESRDPLAADRVLGHASRSARNADRGAPPLASRRGVRRRRPRHADARDGRLDARGRDPPAARFAPARVGDVARGSAKGTSHDGVRGAVDEADQGLAARTRRCSRRSARPRALDGRRRR